MQLGREIKRRLKAAIAPLIFLSLVGYFGWNAVQGNHGLVAYAQRQQLLTQALADQAQSKADKDAWDLRVSALRSRHLDADMLDERSRAMLNLANPNDIIVSYGPQDHVF
jgi:cell division protein FtsB